MNKLCVRGSSQYERVKGLVDLTLLEQSTVVGFGLGSGGQQVMASLAALGVGGFHLIDPGTLETVNIGTTAMGHSDCGLPKVEVARRRILDINPSARVATYQKQDSNLPVEELEAIVSDADLVLQLTDSASAACRLNELGLRLDRDVIHAGTHPGNRSFELIGTLRDDRGPRLGCYRCFALDRASAYDAGDITESPSFPAFRASAEMRNAVISYVALGLLHFRAGSPHEIADWGAAFARLPCWIGRLTPDVFGGLGQLFGDAPDDLFFGVRAYRDPLPRGFVCVACRTRGV